MSEDIAFQIQLGVILPKMKEALTDSVLAIVEELAQTINAGRIDPSHEFPLEAAKMIFMKDFDIQLVASFDVIKACQLML